MTSKQANKARNAAAFWLFDQVGVRGEWARLTFRAPYGGLERGYWYAIQSHDPQRRTLCLQVADKLVEVHIDLLIVRADLPEKTVVFSEGKWAERPPAEMTYVAVCPRGHEQQLGGAPPAMGDPCMCSACAREYPWEIE